MEEKSNFTIVVPVEMAPVYTTVLAVVLSRPESVVAFVSPRLILILALAILLETFVKA